MSGSEAAMLTLFVLLIACEKHPTAELAKPEPCALTVLSGVSSEECHMASCQWVPAGPPPPGEAPFTCLCCDTAR